jgi:hypothetical protein
MIIDGHQHVLSDDSIRFESRGLWLRWEGEVIMRDCAISGIRGEPYEEVYGG